MKAAKPEVNQYSHFYLYSKGWYKRKDEFKDLKKILSRWCGVKTKYLNDNDVINTLSTITYLHLNNEHCFKTFLGGVRREVYNGDCLDIAIVRNLLAVLANVDRNGFGTLAKPDPKILPLTKF